MTVIDFLKTVGFGIPIGVTIIDLVGYVARVDGCSMKPSLNPNSNSDYVFLNKLTLRLNDISRGDVVSLLSPKDPEQRLIKRVIGVEGDIINTVSYSQPIIEIPRGHCWVEGDNTGNSLDSNNFGPISLSLIVGKATAIVWPPSRWQYLKSEIPKQRNPVNFSMRS